jgi:SOS response regulatory protein OraA/RecX
VPALAREEALETLERVGLVDDARVAATRARSLAERGSGDAAIRYDLEREGVSVELVECALAALEPERERARAFVELRGTGPRTARWLAAKGFEAAIVEDALGGFDARAEFADDV